MRGVGTRVRSSWRCAVNIPQEDIYRKGLEKTRGSLWDRLRSVFGGRQSMEVEDLERVEEILIGADVGMDYTMRMIRELSEVMSKASSAPGQDLLLELLRKQIGVSLAISQGGLFLEGPHHADSGPRVILMVGVNGSGKTTTIGKLAARMKRSGQDVIVVGADTYRAAAIEQLRIWAERSGAGFIGGIEGGDPAAVVHDALSAAKARGVDSVIIDTAGRLHTKLPLMKELEKISRVADRVIEGAPHHVLLVLDATTGQNALVQAREFSRSSGVSGIVLTKMDGTAKGGILIPLSGELGLPVLYVGLGEGIGDLVPFDREQFARGMVG